jgi:hypothetical protein
MNFRLLSLLLLGVFTFFTACDKETQPQDNPSPDAAQLTSFFADNNSDAIQQFTIDVSTTAVVTGAKGTQFTFYPNMFSDANGNIVTGNVDLEIIEIFDKEDMLFLNKQTVGNDNGSFKPLISGGEFMVKAYQNGNELNARWGYQADVPAPNGVDMNMEIFYQGNSSSDTLIWNVSDSSFLFPNSNNGYTVYFDSLNWVNLDYFMNFPGNQTSVSVDVPDGFDNTNCAVFISFDGYNSLVRLYDYVNGYITSGNYYTIPEGMPVHFIALAYINNVPHAAIVPSTISNNHLEVISALTATTEAQLATDIANLP